MNTNLRDVRIAFCNMTFAAATVKSLKSTVGKQECVFLDPRLTCESQVAYCTFRLVCNSAYNSSHAHVGLRRYTVALIAAAQLYLQHGGGNCCTQKYDIVTSCMRHFVST